MSGEKVTRQVTAVADDKLTALRSQPLQGYEIHMGETRPVEGAAASPLLHLDDGRTDGYQLGPQCIGTYLHGILDNRVFVDFLLQPFADRLAADAKPFDYQAFKELQYNLLADHVRQHVDIDKVYQILTNND